MTARSEANSRVLGGVIMGRSRRSESGRSDGVLRWSRQAALAAALALVGSACAGSEAAKPATAEDYFNQGLKVLEGSKRLFFFTNVDYPAAIAAFQEVITNFPFSEYATLAELKVADAYFAQRKFEESASFYQDFIELHPTHPQVPYALLRNGECAFNQILLPDQDQAKTKAAVEQFDALIQKHPGSDQIPRARELRGRALDQLALHEVLVGDFYFKNTAYHAAVPRYKEALETSATHPGHQSTRARLGISLRRMGQRQEGTKLLEGITADGLDGDLIDEVEAEIGKPVPEAPGKESAGFSLWPFGGDDEDDAAKEPASPEPAQTAPSNVEQSAVEATAGQPLGSGASVPAEEPEQGSRRWFWPF
jgi:outer membrane protein assembly factor BamD